MSPEPLYLIWSIEHGAWWRPARCGYTIVLADAGRYTARDAFLILKQANVVRVNECAIPAAYVGDDVPAGIVLDSDELYAVARRVILDLGMPWTDPRTGITYPTPALATAIVRAATDDEQRAALVGELRRRVQAGDASHDCYEWIRAGACELCDRPIE